MRPLVPVHSFNPIPHRVLKMIMLAMCRARLENLNFPIGFHPCCEEELQVPGRADHGAEQLIGKNRRPDGRLGCGQDCRRRAIWDPVVSTASSGMRPTRPRPDLPQRAIQKGRNSAFRCRLKATVPCGPYLWTRGAPTIQLIWNLNLLFASGHWCSDSSATSGSVELMCDGWG